MIIDERGRRIAQPEQIDDLAAAAVTAALQGVASDPRRVAGASVADAVLDHCSGAELVVIGPGPAADALMSRGGMPVLVAV
jgi:hypothetical protein